MNEHEHYQTFRTEVKDLYAALAEGMAQGKVEPRCPVKVVLRDFTRDYQEFYITGVSCYDGRATIYIKRVPLGEPT